MPYNTFFILSTVMLFDIVRFCLKCILFNSQSDTSVQFRKEWSICVPHLFMLDDIQVWPEESAMPGSLVCNVICGRSLPY